MRKNITAILLALLFVLTACGQSPEEQWQEQYDLGMRYLSEGNYEEAIIAFTAAIEIDPKRAETYVGRGDAYIGSGETAENLTAAMADYEEAVAIDETNVAAWLGLADVYIRQWEYDKALEVLREALEKTGNDQSIADKLDEMEGGNFVDSTGKLRRMEYRDRDGAVLWWHDYTYNDAGQVIKTVVFDATGNEIDQWDGDEYDSYGRAIRTAGYSFDTGEFTIVSELVYDGDRLIEDHQFFMDGSSAGSSRFEYDDQGNRIKTIGYDINGAVSYYWIHTYDDTGHEIRVDYYYADGVTYGYCERRYDESGNEIGFYQYDQNGNLEGYTVY